METGETQEIASELLNPEHRLPGEADSETSTLLEDAMHWLQVYHELLTFTRTLLRTAEVHKEGAPEAVVAEVSDDQRLLEAELSRLEQRHRFWRERAQQLRAS